MIRSKDISKSIIKMSQAGLGAHQIAEGLGKFIVKHSLQSLLKNVERELDYFEKSKSRQNRLIVKVANPKELSSQALEEIKKVLKAKTAPLEIIEDQKLGAGFIAEYQNTIFDGSAKNQLEKMKGKFNRPNY